MNTNAKRVIEIARSWDRKSINVIPGCPVETCAFFVRFVFRQALHQLGVMPVTHYRTYYSENEIKALPTNENFADGLAGDQVGRKVNIQEIQAGDLLFFKDTYRGNFPVGSITHVGIALDSNGMMADSSSGQCHVRPYRFISGELVEVRRPRCLSLGSNGVGVTFNKGQIQKSGNLREIAVRYGVTERERIFEKKKPGSKPRVAIDGKPFQYQYITVDITLAGRKHIKLFHHDGKTNAIVAEHKAAYLEVVAKVHGGLHIWADGKEVKPSSCNIGVS